MTNTTNKSSQELSGGKTVEEQVQGIVQKAISAGQRNPAWIGTEYVMEYSNELMSLFSSLTEQMIPEERKVSRRTPKDIANITNNWRKGFNHAIFEMKARREKLLK